MLHSGLSRAQVLQMPPGPSDCESGKRLKEPRGVGSSVRSPFWVAWVRGPLFEAQGPYST